MSPPTDAASTHDRRWAVLWVMNLSLVIVVAGNSSLNVALPSIVRELDAVSLGVEEGDAIGVVGRNGDGKTTLLQVLTGSRPPDSGRATQTSGLSVGYLQQADEFAAGDTVLIVHSGSRGLGQRILRAHTETHGAGPAADPEAYLAAHDDAVRWGHLNRRIMAERVADLFEKRRKQLESAFDKTDLAKRGWTFADITQYLYASVQRGAREMLEERGALVQREKHSNGVEWVFWAEEAGSNK